MTCETGQWSESWGSKEEVGSEDREKEVIGGSIYNKYRRKWKERRVRET